MGGHSRVPMIQAAVRELVGEWVTLLSFIFTSAEPLFALIRTMISQNVNTDEAAVLGGAFYGATLSRQFKTKKIKLQDISIHDLQVSYETEGKSGESIRESPLLCCVIHTLWLLSNRQTNH